MYRYIREVKKKKKKNIWMDLVHNGGGGFRAESTFARIFFTFNVKIMSKNWKRNDKTMVKKKHSPFLGGAGGGVFR